jgi:integrase
VRDDHIHHKKAKGRHYYYFDTGQRDERGKRVFLRLPDKRDPAFPRAYANACDQRSKRKFLQPVRTFDWLVRAYEKSPEFRRLAANTQRSYLTYLGKASKLIRGPDGGSASIEAIEPRDILAVRDLLMDGGGANQAVRCLSVLFSWAAKPVRQFMPGNPATAVDLFEEGEHEPWPDWLVEEALRDEAMRPIVGLFYFTGQRIGDVVRMQWTDLKDGHISVRQRKTKVELQIPIAGELAQILQELPRRGFTILAQPNGKAWSDNSLRLKLQAWAREHGVEIVPHGLRKNAVNALLEAECSTAEVSAITGQSLKMVEHYGKRRDQKRLGGSAILKFDAARQKRGEK